jgi:hypothetical protein
MSSLLFAEINSCALTGIIVPLAVFMVPVSITFF